MKVLIEALTAREGGGLTYIQRLLPHLVAAFPDWKLSIILSPLYQSDLIEQLPAEVNPICPTLPAKPIHRRLNYLWREIPGLSRTFDAYFAVSEIGAWRTDCPRVALVRNLNLFKGPLREAPLSEKVFRFAHRRALRPQVRRVLTRADHLVFVSDALRKQVLRHIKVSANRTSVVHHGVDDAFLEPARSTPQEHAWLGQSYILAVSSVTPHKNYRVLFHAFCEVARDRPDLQLVVAGSLVRKKHVDELVRLGQDLGMNERIHLIGVVPHLELPALYQNAAVVVMPSSRESFGLTLVEAMASEAPLIASDTEAGREICGDAALFFAPDSSLDLSMRLTEVLEDEELQKQLRGKSKLRGRRFSWRSTASSIGGILKKVADIRSQGLGRQAVNKA